MGHFRVPDWQGGYRYISFGDNLIGVKRDRPVPILMTYDPHRREMPTKSNFIVLGRLLLSLRTEFSREYFHQMGGKSHRYHPWGIENSALCASDKLNVRLTASPLIDEKGFLLNVKIRNRCEQPLAVELEATYGGMGSVQEPRMVTEFSEAQGNEIVLKDDVAFLTDNTTDRPAVYGAFGSSAAMGFKVIDYKSLFDHHTYEIESPLVRGTAEVGIIPSRATKDIYFVALFGDSAEELAERMRRVKSKPKEHLRRTKKYFAGVSETSVVRTPDPRIDKAFETAVLDLEYTWRDGLGWLEIVSYWCDLWAQTHLAGACSLRQTERAKSCLQAHAKALREDGKVMCFNPPDKPQAVSEWEHFFTFGAYQYYLATGDLRFIEDLWPPLVKMYDYCFSTKDKGKNLLLSWWGMLENQEDAVQTYYSGSSATMAGVGMSKIMATFARALGKSEDGERYSRRAKEAEERLFEKLWKKDLGRFIWWTDELGVEHTESQYHTYAWPIILGATDLLDSYTSLKHLRETLISSRDIVYNSNQFPDDRLSCLGAQESILVSGVAAVAFGKTGDADTCARIIKGCSRCIMDPPMEGIVPEQAQIDFQSYFSSAAANFAWGVVHGLFGLAFNVPESKVTVQPAIPDAWDNAQIELRDSSLAISQDETSITVRLKTPLSLRHDYKIRVPISEEIRCTVDGKDRPFELEPRLNGYFVRLETEPAEESVLAIRFKRRAPRLDYEADVTPGAVTDVYYEDYEILEVTDRQGLLEGNTIEDHTLRLRFKDDAPHGSHTLFLKCKGQEGIFYLALDLIIHQKIEMRAEEQFDQKKAAPAILMRITNRDANHLTGPLTIELEPETFGRQIDLKKGGELAWSIPLSDSVLSGMTPGTNIVNVGLPDGSRRPVGVLMEEVFVKKAAARAGYENRQIHLDMKPHLSHSFEEFIRLRQQIDGESDDTHATLPEALSLSEIGHDQGMIVDPKTGLGFQINGRRVCCVHSGRNEVTIPVGMKLEKLYLLLAAYLTVEDTYSKVGEVSLNYDSGRADSLDLTIPGNIDWCYFYRGYESSRRWTSGLAIVYPNSVLNIIDLPANRENMIESVTLKTNGLRPTFGLMGVTLLKHAE